MPKSVERNRISLHKSNQGEIPFRPTPKLLLQQRNPLQAPAHANDAPIASRRRATRIPREGMIPSAKLARKEVCHRRAEDIYDGNARQKKRLAWGL